MLIFRSDELGLTEKLLPQLAAYHARLQRMVGESDYSAAEASLVLPGDEANLANSKASAGPFRTKQLKWVVVVGIGGSNLGTKAIYDALKGYADLVEPDHFPKMLFAETVDSEWLIRVHQYLIDLAPDEAVIVLISKSGSTTETIANFEILTAGLACPIVVITDQDSNLWQAATKRAWPRLAIPTQVGGRYSVFSPVGLFPLALAGFDIAALLEGARQLRDSVLAGKIVDSGPAQSATLLAVHRNHGQTIYDTFLFHSELESLGKWYRQLLGESIGKQDDRTGQTVHAGITPTVSLGSTDLHSVGQLYLGGPRDKYTTFVSTETSQTVVVPTDRRLGELVPMINQKSAAAIMAAILSGTRTAYREAGLAYNDIILTTIDEASLGAFLQFKMLEVMYLGELLNVNAFDQPSVESYKAVTRKILES